MFKNFRLSLLTLFLICSLAAFAVDLVVDEVNFTGNILFSELELARVVATQPGDKFEQKSVNGDVKRLAGFYSSKGHLNVKVFTPEISTSNSNLVGVTFVLEEGEEFRIKETSLSGNRYISKVKIAEAVELTNHKLTGVPKLLQNIVDYYSQNGFFFATAKLDSLKQTDDGYEIQLKIAEGEFCEFDDVRYKGNKVTTEKSLLKISQLRNMQKITPRLLESAEENIRRKSYIKDCRIYPVNAHQLLIEVDEGRMNHFSGILGYDNNQDADNRISGFLNLEFLNLYGSDRNLALTWQKLQSNNSSIELKYHESGFETIPLSGDLALYREEADSTYINSRVETNIYFHNLFQKYGLYYALETYYPGSRRPKLIETSTYHKIGGFWQYDDTDYYLNPRKGSFIGLKYYYIIDQKKGVDTDKQAVEASVKRYWPLNNRLIGFTGFNASYMENKNLQDYENFELGGSKNLRGFMEKQFYGHQILWTNLELRYLVSQKSRFFLFSDYGFVENNVYRYGKLFGFGGGMRLETKIGLLGIDYGFGYANGEWRNPMDGIIHFGLEANL